MIKYFSILLLTLSINIAQSCSCLEYGEMDDEQYNSYELIISGKVISVNDSLDFFTFFQVQVYNTYKGHLKKDTINLVTAQNSGMCGIYPKTNQEWLFFGTKSASSFDISSCSRSKIIPPAPKSYLYKEYLEDLFYLIRKSIIRKFLFYDM
jgi:hypothetical protein